MPILGDATAVVARLTRSTSNALRVQLATPRCRTVGPVSQQRPSLWLLNENVGALKAPSAGALLELRAPVAPALDDVLAAACVDFSVLPRGYIA